MIYDEEIGKSVVEEEAVQGGDEELGYGGEVIKLSMNSVVGLTTPQTMKLRGLIERQPVVVLVDGEATHNFIASELVQQLSLLRTERLDMG